MKKIIIPFISIIILTATFYFINPISDKLASIFGGTPKINLKDVNKYSKDGHYLYVEKTNNYVPYSFQDLLNIYYSVINNGWDQFTFYCPKEYKNCIKDVSQISGDELILTHLNNYVHPFNSFTNVKSSISDSGEITLKVFYLYDSEKIKEIDKKTDELLESLIKDNMNDTKKIKTIHDYIINNTKYDIERNLTGNSKYESFNAYGPLFQGYATCNGYTDLMAIFLTKMGFDNYKIATTPDEISYSATGHIWNAVKVNDEWLHLDLTWDDPVSNDGKDYLFHTYFLKTTEEVKDADDGETVIEEHNFNSLYYLEFN